MTVELKEVKSSLARLLASENLTVQHANVRTASFNVQDRVLTCPTLQDMGSELYDTIMGHEVAHALWTPADGWGEEVEGLGKNFHGFLNVVEDARIERLIKAKFPGLNKSFYKGYNDLHNNRDFFKIAEQNVAEMLLIDRINLKAKLGSLLDYEFTDEKEIEYFNRAMTTVTWDEVVALAKELYDYAKEELENAEEEQESAPQMMEQSDDGEQMMEMPSDSDEEGEESESAEQGEQEQSGEESGEQNESESSEQGEETSESETQEQQEVETAEEKEKVTTGKEGGESKSNDPVAITEQNARESMQDLVVDEDTNVYHVDMPTKIDYEKVIVPSQQVYADMTEWFGQYYRSSELVWDKVREEYKKIESSNKKVVNYLAKEFEMKKAAKEQARAFVSKTGQINTNKLYSYKYNEDIFNRKTELPNGKNHGMMFYLDWSGSMHGQMANTLDQLINLVMFCKRVNIPFEVYAFSDRFADEDIQEQIKGEFALNRGFRLIQLTSSTLNKRDYVRSLEALVAFKMAFSRGIDLYIPYQYFLGGTPLDCAIATANDLIPEFQKKNRIEIVNAVFLTDGCSHTMDDMFSRHPERKYETLWGTCTKIVRDKKSGAQVVVAPQKIDRFRVSRATNQMNTKALYEIVKKSTGATMVGFHLVQNRDFINEIFRPYGMWNEGCDALPTFKKQKSMVVSHTGLDELYVVKGGRDLSLDDEDAFEGVDSTASKAKLKSAFKKATGGKIENRVILSRFVEKIAANM